MKKVGQKAFLLNSFMHQKWNLQLVLSIHLIKTFNFKAVTYNCRGLLSSIHDVKALCKKYNIIYLQETWFAKQNLSYMTTISSTHYAFGIFSINYESGLLVGRPRGGTAILCHKSLQFIIMTPP